MTTLHHPDDDRHHAPEGTCATTVRGAPPGPPGPLRGSSGAGHEVDDATLAARSDSDDATRPRGVAPQLRLLGPATTEPGVGIASTLLQRAGAPPRDDLGPAGQTVWPWVPSQGGLDGRSYALPAPAAPLPETPPGSSPRLGPLHGVSGQHRQLDLWTRQDLMATYLRCRCPGLDVCPAPNRCDPRTCPRHEAHRAAVELGLCLNRCAKCGVTPYVAQEDIPLIRNDRGAHRFANVVRCDHWTCPACGTQLGRSVASQLGASIQAWLANNTGYREEEAPYDVWLFTTTIPHYADDAMEVTIAALYAAWERFAQSRGWRDWAKRVGVRAHVRVFDASFGGHNGTHPHFHIALFVDGVSGFRHAAAMARAMTGSKKTAFEVPGKLIDAWLRAVRASGIKVGRKKTEPQFRRRALQLQGGDAAAAYFCKWGLANETGATTLKKGGPLALLDAAGAGYAAAGELYRAFCIAVHGRQVVTGLADTLRMVGVSEDDVERYRAERQARLDEEHPPVLVAPLSLVVRRCLWRTALELGRGLVVAEVDRASAAGEDPQAALDQFLWCARRALRATLLAPPIPSGVPDG